MDNRDATEYLSGIHDRELGLEEARPTRIAFCTAWKLFDKETVEIEDEFTEINLPSLPHVVAPEQSIYAAIFWEGQASNLKPTLKIETPGAILSVQLQALKPYFWTQVQVNSLAGFEFSEAGRYRFSVTSGKYSLHRDLTVMSITSISILQRRSGTSARR